MIKFDSESELQQFIIDNREGINKKSFFDFSDKLTREIGLSGYGRVDLIDYKINGTHLHIDIIELKNVRSSYSELAQLCRYVSGVKLSLENDFESLTVNGYLVAPEFDDHSDFPYFYNNTDEDIYLVQIELDPLTGVDFSIVEKDFFNRSSMLTFETIQKTINHKTGLIDA